MKKTFGAQFDTLRRAGMGRIARRLSRRFRRRCLYPLLGPWLFPSSRGGISDLDPAGELPGIEEGLLGGTTDLDGLLQGAEEVSQNQFRYLNLPPVNMGNPIAWRSLPYEDPLWSLQLHHGEWALVLAHALRFSGEGRFREALLRLLTDWVEHNPVGWGAGWEPYPTCLRMVYWSKAAMVLAGDPGWQDFSRRILAPSLRQQANYLALNLEEDLGNNHLLANYRALAWMGLLFPRWPEAAQWRELGLAGLWREMNRQVLDDGVHDEISVSYHLLVLQDLMETRKLCQAAGEPVPEEVEGTLERMVCFLGSILAPDGTYPMLNDTVPGYPLDPREVLFPSENISRWPEGMELRQEVERSYASWLTGTLPGPSRTKWGEGAGPSVKVFPRAGYAVLRSGADEMLSFDAGPMGPAHLQGHGHADALSFSLFAGGRWLLTDPGVFSYHDPFWRSHFRSTRAHNTVSVDGQDQCVFWGPFRVAYPPSARLLDWGEDSVAGEHQGYARLKDPLVHRRQLRRRGQGEWEIADHFSGRGIHDFLFNLQLAPGGRAEVSGLNAESRWPDGVTLKILCPAAPAGAKAGMDTGWVSSGWNLKEEVPRYVLRWRGRVPLENRVILKIKDRYA